MLAIVTNMHLKLYGIRMDDKCSNCEAQKETLQHLFFDCPTVQTIWKTIEEIIKTEITYRNVVFCTVKNNPKAVENCIILITKFYIYRSRCVKERISITSCKNFIESYHDEENNA